MMKAHKKSVFAEEWNENNDEINKMMRLWLCMSKERRLNWMAKKEEIFELLKWAELF